MGPLEPDCIILDTREAGGLQTCVKKETAKWPDYEESRQGVVYATKA